MCSCSCPQPCRAYLRREGACDGGGSREGKVQRSRPQLPDRQVGGRPPSSAQPQSQSTSGPNQLSCQQLPALAPSREDRAAVPGTPRGDATAEHSELTSCLFYLFLCADTIFVCASCDHECFIVPAEEVRCAAVFVRRTSCSILEKAPGPVEVKWVRYHCSFPALSLSLYTSSRFLHQFALIPSVFRTICHSDAKTPLVAKRVNMNS